MAKASEFAASGGKTLKSQIFDESTGGGTWTRPSGVEFFWYRIWAAGGGGGNVTGTSSAADGGGAGEFKEGWEYVNGDVSVSLGAAGTGGAIGGDNGGGDAGDTTLTGGVQQAITAYGGDGQYGNGGAAYNGPETGATTSADSYGSMGSSFGCGQRLSIGGSSGGRGSDRGGGSSIWASGGATNGSNAASGGAGLGKGGDGNYDAPGGNGGIGAGGGGSSNNGGGGDGGGPRVEIIWYE